MKAHIAHVVHAWALAGFGSVHVPGIGNFACNTIGYHLHEGHLHYLKHIFITWE